MRPHRLACFLVLLGLPGRAHADTVLSQRSDWDESGTRIYTEVIVARDDGRIDTVRVPGGKVGDLGMVQFAVGGVGGTSGAVGGLSGAGLSGPLLNSVRSASSAGTPLRWAKSEVYIDPDAAGVTDLPGDTEQQVIVQVIHNWEDPTRSCGYLTFNLQDPKDREVGYDGYNVVKFREDACESCGTWCRPALGDEPEDCYEATAAALTTVFFVDKAGASNDGTIVDTDVELNAVNFKISVGGVSSGTGTDSDLENTLTHEFGHVIGLDHTCWDQAGTPPLDNDGNPVPNCFPESDLPLTVTEPTMYNFQAPGETKKSSLEQDDIDGFCTIYPLALDPHAYGRAISTGGGWCDCAVGSGRARRDAGGALLALALTLLACSRIRRR